MKRSLIGMFAAALLCAGCGAQTESTPTTITIGALLPLTGELSSYGQASQAALKVALADINAYLEGAESSLRIALTIRDTRTDPDVAFEELLDLSAANVSLVIGPMGSEELNAIRSLSGRVGTVLISPSAGLSSLAVEDDNVFRMIPTDTSLAETLAESLTTNGIEAIALLARDGVWGDELSADVSERFADRGGTTVGTHRYDPSTASNDYRADLDALSSVVEEAVADFGTNAVAVVFVGYDEGVQVFKQASTNETLAATPWYGTDGFAACDDLLQDAQAAAFAVSTGYSAPMYDGDQVDPARRDAVREPIEASLGRTADTFALLSHDALWLAALAEQQTGGARYPNTIRAAIPSVAAIFNGASGFVNFDDTGDRTGGTYDLWTVVDSNGVYSWEQSAAPGGE